MRVRDVLSASLAALTPPGLLPPCPARVRINLPPERPGAIWSNKQLTRVLLGSVDGSFHGDDAAWRRAVEFLEGFKASGAARHGPSQWTLTRCFGPFAHVSPAHAYERMATALQGAGMSAASPFNPNAPRGRFRATDKVRMTSLPVFYGQWLSAQYGSYPWEDVVELELVIEANASSEHSPQGGDEPLTYLSVGLSAAAISLMLDISRQICTLIGPPSPPADPARAAAAPRMLANQVAARWGQRPPFVIA